METDATTTSGPSSGMIAAASLSVVSTLGFVGTCLMNHKDIILDKMRCWISWGVSKDDDDIEAQRTITSPRPTATDPQVSFPQISFPIVINNSSGEQRPATVTLPSPFQERPQIQRSHSDPNPSTSESEYHDTTPTSSSRDGTSSNSSSSADVVHRRISLDEKHSY